MAKTATKVALPKGVLASDIDYSYSDKDPIVTGVGDYGSLTFYLTDRMGWCVTTLKISNGKNGFAARTYGMSIDNKSPVSIGGGPHVKQVVTIYIKESRRAALQDLIDLYDAGMEKAGARRDRIGSRRIEGAQRRAEGQRRWYWDAK